MTLDQLTKLARRVWYGKGVRNGTAKSASFSTLKVDARSIRFPFGVNSMSYTPVDDSFEVRVQFPRWDYPGLLEVRKIETKN